MKLLFFIYIIRSHLIGYILQIILIKLAEEAKAINHIIRKRVKLSFPKINKI